MDRACMRYLEKVDPELRTLQENEKGIPVHYTTIEYKNGLINCTIEDMLDMDN